MPIAKIQLPDGRTARFEVPEGTTPDQVMDFAAKRFMVPASAPRTIADHLRDVADDEGFGSLRAGLAKAGGATLDAIAGLFGDDAAQAVQGALSGTRNDSAERGAASEALRDTHPVASFVGDVGANAGLMYAGGAALRGVGALAGAANATRAGAALQGAGRAMQAPTSYRQAAAGGAAYGAATTQGDLVDRAQAGLAGGIGGAVGLGIGRGIGAAANTVINKVRPASGGMANGAATASVQGNVDQQLGVMLNAEGIDFAALPRAAQDALRQMATQANRAGQPMNPAAVARMADFQQLGIAPLSGWVSREPQDYLLAHSLKGVDDSVTQRWAGADAVLAGRARAGAPDISDYQAGDALRQTVAGRDAGLKAQADAAYQRFRDMGGRDIQLDPVAFNNDVAIELDRQMAGSKLPASVLSWFQKIQPDAQGKVAEPFTFDTAAQRLEALNKMIYNTNDRAEAYALNIVKGQLLRTLQGAEMPAGMSGTPAVPGSAPTQQQLAEAFGQARGAAASRFKFHEASPIHEAIVTGKFTPEKLPDLMRTLRVDDLQAMAKADQAYGTNTLAQLRQAAEIFIRDKAVLQGETGGKFSQAGLRRALDQLGPENGQLLLGKERWGELQTVLRAGGAMQNQPAGIVANNSGTGHSIANLIKRMPIPGLPASVNLAVNLGQKVQMNNQAQAQLQAQLYRTPGLLELLQESAQSPAAMGGGLLGYFGGAGGAVGASR